LFFPVIVACLGEEQAEIFYLGELQVSSSERPDVEAAHARWQDVEFLTAFVADRCTVDC
jgi:hypothetical protein